MGLAIRLVPRLRGNDYARFPERDAEYDPRPPFGVGTPEGAGEQLTLLSCDFLALIGEEFRAPTSAREPE